MNIKNLLVSLILFLIGFILVILGSLFKIQHWPYGSELLTLGMFLKVIAAIILIIKLIKYAKTKQ
ncbi:GldL-related protein [Lacinutrix salivirga]